MEKFNPDKKNLKNFGITMCITFLVITGLIIIKHRHSIAPTAVISGVFLLSALIYPLLLKPIYLFWMRLAFTLGLLNTRLILLIIFYVIFTPVGLVLRLSGADLLDRKINKNKESYWRKKERNEFNHLNYERQF